MYSTAMIPTKRAAIFAAILAFAFCAAPDSKASEKAGEKSDSMIELLDAPLLFVKRHSYTGIHIYDTFYKWPPGGGGIYVLENPQDPKSEWKIKPVIDESTPETLGHGVYSQPELSWDATRLLFCFKGEPTGSTSIYEIGVDGKGLRRVTDPEPCLAIYKGKGGGQHDVDPSYLPDGRIVFSSTRPSGLVPCANSGVAILHVMNEDGTNIHPISVNAETEFDPAVLPDGRLVFGRWEYVDKNALTIQSLWTAYPDGTMETALFANNMVFPEATLDVRPVPNSRLLAITMAKHNHTPRGSIAMIDPHAGKNGAQAIYNFEHPDDPTNDTGDSCEPYPLNSNTVIFSGRPKGQERNIIEMIDRSGLRIEILSDPEICLHSPMLVKPRPVPAKIPEMADFTQKTGAFFVRDIYQGLEGVKKGEAKWLRVIEETSRVSESPGSPNPFNQTFLLSAALAFAVKNYLGVVPIQDDGSAYFNAPSGRALYFQLLDKDKRLIQSMRTFIQAAPGTVRSCVGCHERKSDAPGAADRNLNAAILKRAPEEIKPESWGTGYLDYTNMVQPVWDKHCVSCHGGEKGVEGRLDLSGGWTEHFNISYENLVDRRETQLTAYLISGIDCMNGTAHWSCQRFASRSHGSATAPLAKVIMTGHEKRIEGLTETDRDLVMAWIDGNGLYYGNWDYTSHGYGLSCWNEIRGNLASEMKKANCGKCHDNYFANDWINLQKPELSRILRAPLAPGDEGHGLAICQNQKVDPKRNRLRLLRDGYAHAVKPVSAFAKQPIPPIQEGGKPEPSFDTIENPHYQTMLNIIKQGRRQALATPRVDMPGAEPIPGESRMFIPPPPPRTAPSLRAASDRDGIVRLSWERSARTIGLSSELHGGSRADFTPRAETLLASTKSFQYVDKNAPQGPRHYALVMRSGAERSEPARSTVDVPAPRRPSVAANLKATPSVGGVQLAWANAEEPNVRYNVYRKKGDGGGYVKLNPEPTVASSYADWTAPPDMANTYTVKAVSRRGLESVGAPDVTATALPQIKEPMFVAAFDKNADALLYAGGASVAKPYGKAMIAEGFLDLRDGGYLTFEHRSEFDLTGEISISLRLKMTQESAMPVVVSCGQWNQAGWFLQRIGGGWRWHVGGIDCDGGKPALGAWTELVATFDGQTARLFQDGKMVGEKSGSVVKTSWSGPLHVGQYSGGAGSQYQVNGLISDLRIYSRAIKKSEVVGR